MTCTTFISITAPGTAKIHVQKPEGILDLFWNNSLWSETRDKNRTLRQKIQLDVLYKRHKLHVQSQEHQTHSELHGVRASWYGVASKVLPIIKITYKQTSMSWVMLWEISEKNWISSAKKLNMRKRWTDQQDNNNSKYTAKIKNNCNNVKTTTTTTTRRPRMAWSISWLESYWNFMEDFTIASSLSRPLGNLGELNMICLEKWAKTEPQRCTNRIISHHRHLKAVTAITAL